MSKHSFEKQLAGLGFSDKEASVYVTSLALGPATVQSIAEKSGVKRASVYVMIESLVARGLMSTFVQGKKTYYKSENPEQLQNILNEEAARLADKKSVLREILPILKSTISSSSEHPNVNLYSGIEGLNTIHDLVRSSKTDELLNIVSLDDAERIGITNHDDVANFRKDLASRKVKVRCLYSSSNKKPMAHEHGGHWQVKRIPDKFIPFHGEITVFGDKVAFISYRGALVGSIIESSGIAQAVRVLFELAWASTRLK
jgi:HTH-type transcriptional regulator, sugar sensing transcriptional regulator